MLADAPAKTRVVGRSREPPNLKNNSGTPGKTNADATRYNRDCQRCWHAVGVRRARLQRLQLKHARGISVSGPLEFHSLAADTWEWEIGSWHARGLPAPPTPGPQSMFTLAGPEPDCASATSLAPLSDGRTTREGKSGA